MGALGTQPKLISLRVRTYKIKFITEVREQCIANYLCEIGEHSFEWHLAHFIMYQY